MAEENTPNTESQQPEAEVKEAQTSKAKPTQEQPDKPAVKAKPAAKKEKAPALEDKPFPEFMEQNFTPSLKEALSKQGLEDVQISFVKEKLPVAGANSNDQCWQVIGKWNKGERQFNLYFLNENISGQKAFSYTVDGKPPSTIESFMIDERKVTLDLMLLYTLQRLNGQKWLLRN